MYKEMLKEPLEIFKEMGHASRHNCENQEEMGKFEFERRRKSKEANQRVYSSEKSLQSLELSAGCFDPLSAKDYL